MYNKELEKQVHELFKELKAKANNIASEARTNTDATERIMRLVSSTISAEAEGYMVDMYACLVEKIKSEDFFKNPENLNAFYRLNLRDGLNEKYQFNIEDIDAYKNGIEYKDINQLYAAAGAAAGTLALGGILKFALSKVIGIPFVIVIAGAVVAACAAYFAVPTRNRKEYKKAIDKFLCDLENDILDWFVDVEVYFDEQVRTLYK
mgnify:CR=1 FL=1